MFTGIVTDMGEVRSVKPRADNLHRITIACDYPRAELIEGASIACAGVCMTVVETGEEGGRTWFGVDAAAETLALTTVGRWRHGARVNLERSLKLGDELGGHLVAGHVDGLATVVAREDMTDMARFALRAPPQLARFIAPKGSVALDGVSLTVNEVEGDTFSVLIIPHTLAVTTFGALHQGDDVNLEIDTMARYAARLIARA
jgi:riboflavin synthase